MQQLYKECVAYGCNKRRKKRKIEDSKSDSKGSSDTESRIKRKFPRPFHKHGVWLKESIFLEIPVCFLCK